MAVDRRVRRTQKALREAFIALVLERGYERVSVEDITDRADVARATFYAHFADKETLLTALFEEVIGDLTTRLATIKVPPNVVRTYLVGELYRHAVELRDVYRVCLGGAGHGRARGAYVNAVAALVEANFNYRLTLLAEAPRIPVPTMARAFAGAHVALLESWLEADRPDTLDEAVLAEVQLLAYGLAWAGGIPADDLELDLTANP